jgi:hypothetical protein
MPTQIRGSAKFALMIVTVVTPTDSASLAMTPLTIEHSTQAVTDVFPQLAISKVESLLLWLAR